jgi:predicted RNA binding protein YcfA (HicA-like mRNA interferase family)
MPPKNRDILKRLHEEGWYLKEQSGSHRQFAHPKKVGKVTVARHPSDERRLELMGISNDKQDGKNERVRCHY